MFTLCFVLLSLYIMYLSLVMTLSYLTGREMKTRGRSDEQTGGKRRREDVKSKQRKEKETAISKKKKADEKKRKEMSKKTKNKKNERLVDLVEANIFLKFAFEKSHARTDLSTSLSWNSLHHHFTAVVSHN